MTQRRVIPLDAADAPAPRIRFTRKRPAALPALSAPTAKCWSDPGRGLAHSIGQMVSACTEDVFAQVEQVVQAEARRRSRLQ